MEKTDYCSYCGYDLKEYQNLSYEKKLLNAIYHPLRENKMIAIQALGTLRSRKALPLFASLLETEKDFFIIRETMRALKMIGGRESWEMLRCLKKHQSHLVKSEAMRLLDEGH